MYANYSNIRLGNVPFGRTPEITLDHSTLTRYRARLLSTDFGRRLLRMTLADASAAGLLGDTEDLIDSFMIAGAAARQGTLVLIRHAIRRVLIECGTAGLVDAVSALRRSDYADRKKPALNWASAEAHTDFLQDHGADGRALVPHRPTRCRRVCTMHWPCWWSKTLSPIPTTPTRSGLLSAGRPTGFCPSWIPACAMDGRRAVKNLMATKVTSVCKIGPTGTGLSLRVRGARSRMATPQWTCCKIGTPIRARCPST